MLKFELEYFRISKSFSVISAMDVVPSKQYQVIALRQYSSLSKIADQLGITKLTVERILKAADEDGDICIHCCGRCGKKRKTISHYDKIIIRNSVKSP